MFYNITDFTVLLLMDGCSERWNLAPCIICLQMLHGLIFCMQRWKPLILIYFSEKFIEIMILSKEI